MLLNICFLVWIEIYICIYISCINIGDRQRLHSIYLYASYIVFKQNLIYKDIFYIYRHNISIRQRIFNAYILYTVHCKLDMYYVNMIIRNRIVFFFWFINILLFNSLNTINFKCKIVNIWSFSIVDYCV